VGGAYWVPRLLLSFVSLLRKPDSSPTNKSRTHASTAWILRMVELPRSLTNFPQMDCFRSSGRPIKIGQNTIQNYSEFCLTRIWTVSLQSDSNKWHVWNTRNHNSRASHYTTSQQVKSVAVSRFLKTAASKEHRLAFLTHESTSQVRVITAGWSSGQNRLWKITVREHNYITISGTDARGLTKARHKSVRFDEIKFYQQWNAKNQYVCLRFLLDK